MFGLRRGLGTGVGRQTQRLLTEIASDRRPRGADCFAQGLGSEMAIALRNRHCIGVDDEIVRFVLLRSPERVGRRLHVGQHRGGFEILGPGSVGALKHDDAVLETVGGDDVGHAGLTKIGIRRAAYIITTIFNDNGLYVSLSHTIIMYVCHYRQARQAKIRRVQLLAELVEDGDAVKAPAWTASLKGRKDCFSPFGCPVAACLPSQAGSIGRRAAIAAASLLRPRNAAA